MQEQETKQAPVCRRTSKNTIEFHLRPHRIPMDTLRIEHSAVLGMVTKLLGITPRCDQYLALWPEGFETYNVVVPNLFDIPFCDFGVGTLVPDIRSITAYVVSRAYGCPYCASHTAVMGTVRKGCGLTLDKNARAMDAEPSPDVFSPQELAAINIAKKVGAVPATVTTADIVELATHFTTKEQEAIINATAVMGFLNRFMDASGMTLEMEGIEISLAKLAPSGWTAGVAYDEEADRELMEEDRIEAAKREERTEKSGVFSYVKMVIGAKRADAKSLRKIPSSDSGMYDQCAKDAGFVPYYVRDMQHPAAKKAFAFGFLLRICQGSEEVPVAMKHMMCYRCATNAGNTILRAHFAFLASRSGVSVNRLVEIAGESPEQGGSSAAEDTAMSLAEASSWTPSVMKSNLAEMVCRLFSPPAVIELLITLSMFFAYHRWTSVYVPTSYEPEVQVFVEKYGEALGLPASPCTTEQAEWASLAAQTRKK